MNTTRINTVRPIQNFEPDTSALVQAMPHEVLNEQVQAA